MEFIKTILWIIYLVVAFFVAFYVPGRVLLGKTKHFPPLMLQTLSIAIGIVLFSWQGVVFGTFHIRWATYIYLFVFLLIFIFKKYYPKNFHFSLKNIDKTSIGIIAIGIFAQTISYITMGWVTQQGIIISAHNDGDHIWHAALVNELVKRFPPHEPGISGVLLKDYHFFFNLLTADLIRVFHLPLFITQFIGMYILGSILFGLLIYSLLRMIFSSRLFVNLSLFFIFFSGNAAGWYMLLTAHTFDWNVASLIVDATKFMDSPAYGYAIVVGLTGLVLLIQKKISFRDIILIALCFGSLIEYKVYIGITFFAGFGCFALYSLFKKNLAVVIAFILSVILGLSIFLPGTSSQGGLAFIPFDIPRDFINQAKLGHVDWQLRWVIFQDHHNTLRIIQYGLMMSGVYFFIQFGLLLIGIIPSKQTISHYGKLLIFMYPTILVSILMGLLFYQKVGGANIWEFFLAGVPFLELLAAANIVFLIENKQKFVQFVVIGLVVIFIVPQWLISITGYINDEYFKGFHGLSTSEVASFDYIAKSTPVNSTILVLGQQKYVAYASVASIFMQRDLYLSGHGVRQQITPVIYHREGIIKELQTNTGSEKIASILANEHIDYLYVYNGMYPGIYGDKINLIERFRNNIATIYQVK